MQCFKDRASHAFPNSIQLSVFTTFGLLLETSRSSLLATCLSVLGTRSQLWHSDSKSEAFLLLGVDAEWIGASGLSKSFPDVLRKFHVSGRRLWSRLSTPRGLGTIAG